MKQPRQFFMTMTLMNWTSMFSPAIGQDCSTNLSGNQDVCFNLQCPKSLPKCCKDVESSDPRVEDILRNRLKVLCDTQSDGGGWTVIHRRSTCVLDFYRNWNEYKTGFGNVGVGEEFWFGNENIHRMSSRSPHELRIDFKYNGIDYFARYSSFRVLSEQEEYKLLVSGYSGNAGYNMLLQNNMKFTTKDSDNDIAAADNCAHRYHGAWWYEICHHSNLNELWGSTQYGEGLT